MAKYECKNCLYETKNKSDYNKHCVTKKHLEKVTNITNSNNKNTSPQNSSLFLKKSLLETDLQCAHCNKLFARNDNLIRHLKTCKVNKSYNDKLQETVNDMKLKEQIKILNLKLSQSEQNVSKYKEDAVKHEEDAKYYKKMFLEAGNLVKKSVSSLTYVVENFNEAPSLKMLTVDDINNVTDETTEKEIVDDIISAHKHKTLGKYLGDYIIKIYKKTNPKSQSIWNTDDSRLTYLIKELSHNKSSNWFVDKKGHKTTSYIIEPLLTYVKEILTDYQLNFNIPQTRCNAVEMEFILENSKRLLDIINDIDDGNVSKDILRHISTQLRFNTKCIK